MSQIFYSAQTRGFYLDNVHGDERPNDCHPISEALYLELMAGQAVGKSIEACPVNGARLVEYVPTAKDITAAVDAARHAAYADEADPLFFKAQRGEATMEDWQAKVDEIKARYPEGVMPS
ncbi:MAG: hypothetical protein Q4D91_01055 [Lautropia sp.]|nr:hypothetical protein [Lautropia sp.]